MGSEHLAQMFTIITSIILIISDAFDQEQIIVGTPI